MNENEVAKILRHLKENVDPIREQFDPDAPAGSFASADVKKINNILLKQVPAIRRVESFEGDIAIISNFPLYERGGGGSDYTEDLFEDLEAFLRKNNALGDLEDEGISCWGDETDVEKFGVWKIITSIPYDANLAKLLQTDKAIDKAIKDLSTIDIPSFIEVAVEDANGEWREDYYVEDNKNQVFTGVFVDYRKTPAESALPPAMIKALENVFPGWKFKFIKSDIEDSFFDFPDANAIFKFVFSYTEG